MPGFSITSLAQPRSRSANETLLAYHFLRTASPSPAPAELAGRIDGWLKATFGIDVDFKVGAAIEKLEQLGLMRREVDRLVVSPLDAALVELRRVWDGLLPIEKRRAAE